jgi:hypothetical protein
MRLVSTFPGAVVATAIAASANGAFAQASRQMALPQVTVTAPPPVTAPSWKKFTPYFGNSRVEENLWPDIPCRDSRIGVAVAGSCKTGAPQEVAPGLLSAPNSNCRIAHDLVMTNLGPLAVEADVMVFDPYYVSAIGFQHGKCAVQSGYSDLREDFPDMNQVTRKGSGWRNYAENGDLTTMEFSIASADCVAVEKRGPPWRFGRVYVIHASLCRNDRRPVGASDVDYVLGSLRVTTYEPRGNLRAPP